MNKPNPLIPAGSLQDQAKGKSNVRFAVLAVLGVHMVVLMSFLIAGCRKDGPGTETGAPTNTTASVPVWSPETNAAQAALTNPSPDVTQLNTSAPVQIPSTALEPLTPATNTGPDLTVGAQEYKVQRNDNFSTIARKHRTTTSAISSLNPGVESSKLKIGQKIKVPASGTATNSGPAGTALTIGLEPHGEANGSVSSYTVKPGDNLTKLARAHGTTADKLRKLNNLKVDQIRVGQKLKVPARATITASPATLREGVTPLPPAGSIVTTPPGGTSVGQ